MGKIFHPRTGLLRHSEFPRQNAPRTLLIVAFIVFSAVLLGIWTGLYEPRLLRPFVTGWTQDWELPLASGLIALLIIVPVTWVMLSGVLDLLAFFLVQNALLMVGYFFLPVTAYKLTPDFASGILKAGFLVVVINAIGFSVLIAVMFLTYCWGFLQKTRLQPLHDTPERYDLSFKWFLRVTGLFVLIALALPMLKSGVIPLFAENSSEARTGNMESDLQRALYNLGTALMPFLSAGLLILCSRKPLRLLGIDGLIAFSLFLVQLLSGNRFPLAIGAFATFTLLTMERRLPRLLLLSVFAVCMLFFTGFSGLTGLLRTHQGELAEGNPVAASLNAAFTGDNLIDVRDAAWVLSRWDFDPLMGRTYLGGLLSMMPSGLFPLKKEWHLGLTCIRIVGWDPEMHFGLRITFFGESFLNFGLAGVAALGSVLGILFGTLLRSVHLASSKRPPCLHYNLKLVVLMQMCMPLANTSDAFTFWGLCGFLLLQWLAVDFTLTMNNPRTQPHVLHAARSS